MSKRYWKCDNTLKKVTPSLKTKKGETEEKRQQERRQRAFRTRDDGNFPSSTVNHLVSINSSTPPSPPASAGPLTCDVKPDGGGALLQRHHTHDLGHFVAFHDCEIVERLIKQKRESREGPPDPFDV